MRLVSLSEVPERSQVDVEKELVEALRIAIVHRRNTALGCMARHAIRHLGEEMQEKYPSGFNSDMAYDLAERAGSDRAVSIIDKNWHGIGNWMS